MLQIIRKKFSSKYSYSRLSLLVRHLSNKVPDAKSDGAASNSVKQEEKEYIPAGGKGRSALEILKEELKPAFRGEIRGVEFPIPRHTDVLIIGGGLIGTAIAYFLKAQASDLYDVTVVERDYCYTRASSMLSAGGVRHQFTIPENVQMSMFTSEFLKHYKEHLSVYDQDPPEVNFHHQGYLFLAPRHRAEFLEQCVKMQNEQGARTQLLSRNQLAEKFPWLCLDGIAVGSLGTFGEGWFDPWQLVHSLKAKNITNKVRYCEGEVKEFRFVEEQMTSEDGIIMRKRIEGVDIDHKDGKRYGCNAGIIINCAGPWAGEIAKMAGIGSGEKGNTVTLPVEPRKRYVYMVHCPEGPTLDTPFLIDPTGAYFRREGLSGHYICGASPGEEQEPDISDLSVDYEFFNEYVWPILASRVPAFNTLRLKAAWAGYYDYNVYDQNLIFGPHPYHPKFYFANGLSGHGVQHALAIGRAMFELIFYGEYKTIDMSKFSFQRFINDTPVIEHAIV